MQILGFNKTTLLDYPGHLASTIFLGGCNYRCPFCHNASFVLHPETCTLITKEYVLSYLLKRRNILEGVVITGGEPTLSNDLADFLYELKLLGLSIKLDTNGTNPSALSELLEHKLIDYVAMDIKNSKENYHKSIGFNQYDTKYVEESVKLLKNSKISYEFRTTYVLEHHTLEDIHSIGLWLQGDSLYYMQNYKDSSDTISDGLHSIPIPLLKIYYQELKGYMPNVSIRGID